MSEECVVCGAECFRIYNLCVVCRYDQVLAERDAARKEAEGLAVFIDEQFPQGESALENLSWNEGRCKRCQSLNVTEKRFRMLRGAEEWKRVCQDCNLMVTFTKRTGRRKRNSGS